MPKTLNDIIAPKKRSLGDIVDPNSIPQTKKTLSDIVDPKSIGAGATGDFSGRGATGDWSGIQPKTLRENIEDISIVDVLAHLPFSPLHDYEKKGAFEAERKLRTGDYGPTRHYAMGGHGFPAYRPARPPLTRDDLTKIVKDYKAEQERGQTIPSAIASGIADLPSYIGEFAALGPISRGAGAAITKGIGSKALRAVPKAFVRAGVMTAFQPHRTKSALIDQIERGESGAMAYAKAWGDVYIEDLSEMAGEGLPFVVGKMPFGGRIMSGLKNFAKSTGMSTSQFWKKVGTKAGYNGLLAEWGEERLGTFMRGLTDVQDFGAGPEATAKERIAAGYDQDFKVRNLLTEGGVLLAPGTTRFAAQKAFGRMEPEQAQEEIPTAPTDQSQFDKDIAAMDLEQEQHKLSLKEQYRRAVRQQALRDLPQEELAEKLRSTPTTSPFFREIYDEVVRRKAETAAPEPTQATEQQPTPFFEPEEVETPLPARDKREQAPPVEKPDIFQMTKDELQKLPAEQLDQAAFGFNEKNTKILNTDRITIEYKDSMEDAEAKQRNSGYSEKEWANKINISEPVMVTYEGGEFVLQDGHQRYLAAKIRGEDLNIKLEIKDDPVAEILEKATPKPKSVDEMVEKGRQAKAAEIAQQPDALTPKKAKRLTARANQPYKVVEDKEGQEWIVGAVLDEGRLMELIKPETEGEVRKRIASDDYADYKITLGEEDLEQRVRPPEAKPAEKQQPKFLEVEAKPRQRDLLGQPVAPPPLKGKQKGFGFDIKKAPVKEVEVKIDLERAVAKALNEDAQKAKESKTYKGVKNAKQLYEDYGFEEREDLFNDPWRPAVEFEQAFKNATQGRKFEQEKAAEVAEKEIFEEVSGLTDKRRTQLINQVENYIKNDPQYQEVTQGVNEQMERLLQGHGAIYIDPKDWPQVEDIVGKRKGFPTKVQSYFTKSPEAKNNQHWDEVKEYAINELGIQDAENWTLVETVEFIKRAVETQTKGLDWDKVNELSENRPDFELMNTIHEGLMTGESPDEINDKIDDWGEYHDVPQEARSEYYIGEEPKKIWQIQQISDPIEQNKAIEQYARGKLLKKNRKKAVDAVNEVLKANEIDIPVEQVLEIPEKPADDIPFQVRGKPVGAAIVSPAGKELVLLAYGADSATGYHEGYHVLRRRLKPTDIRLLEKYFKNEEAEAAAFARFVKTGQARQFIKGMWQRLKNILTRIKNQLQGLGYKTVDDIFGQIEKGTIAKQAPAGKGSSKFQSLEEPRYYTTKSGRTIENVSSLPDYEDLTLAQLRNMDPETLVSAKFLQGRGRGGASRQKIKVKNILLSEGEVKFAMGEYIDPDELKAEIEKTKKKVKGRKTQPKRFKINIRDTTPPLRADLAPTMKAELPPGKPVMYSEPKLRRTMPVSDKAVPEDILEENRQKERIKDLIVEIKRNVVHVGEGLERARKSISSRLYNINPELKRRIRDLEEVKLERIGKDIRDIEPFLRALQKMSSKDWADMDLFIKNGDKAGQDRMAEKYGFEREMKVFREVDDAILEAANAVGMEIDHRKGHFHRRVRLPKELMAYFKANYGKTAIMTRFGAALAKRKEQAAGRTLTKEEKAQVLNSVLRGYGGRHIWLSKPGGAKERSVFFIDSKINKFYFDSKKSMELYIRDMHDAIAAREFFGRETKQIQRLRATKARLMTSLMKLQKKQGPQVTVSEQKSKEHISKRAARLVEVSQVLDDLKKQDLTQTIGGYIIDIINEGLITDQQQDKVQSALEAYFRPTPLSARAGFFKKIAYMTHLGTILNTMTQLRDYSRILYRAPLQAPGATIRAFTPWLESKYTMSEHGLDDISVDMATVGEALNTQLRATGFRWLDQKLKEIYEDAVITKYHDQSRRKSNLKEGSVFMDRLKEVFGDTKDRKRVIADLKKGAKTQLTKKLGFNEILNMHPVARSEMTETYLRGGGITKYMYTLRTFALKEFEYAENEIFRDMKKNPGRAVGRLMWLMTTVALAGAGVEELRDLIRRRKTKLSDKVLDSWLNLIFMSRYGIDILRREGPGKGLFRTLTPPTRHIDAPVRDVIKGEFSETPRNIPIGGELYYWWFGEGARRTAGKKEGSGTE